MIFMSDLFLPRKKLLLFFSLLAFLTITNADDAPPQENSTLTYDLGIVIAGYTTGGVSVFYSCKLANFGGHKIGGKVQRAVDYLLKPALMQKYFPTNTEYTTSKVKTYHDFLSTSDMCLEIAVANTVAQIAGSVEEDDATDESGRNAFYWAGQFYIFLDSFYSNRAGWGTDLTLKMILFDTTSNMITIGSEIYAEEALKHFSVLNPEEHPDAISDAMEYSQQIASTIFGAILFAPMVQKGGKWLSSLPVGSYVMDDAGITATMLITGISTAYAGTIITLTHSKDALIDAILASAPTSAASTIPVYLILTHRHWGPNKDKNIVLNPNPISETYITPVILASAGGAKTVVGNAIASSSDGQYPLATATLGTLIGMSPILIVAKKVHDKSISHEELNTWTAGIVVLGTAAPSITMSVSDYIKSTELYQSDPDTASTLMSAISGGSGIAVMASLSHLITSKIQHGVSLHEVARSGWKNVSYLKKIPGVSTPIVLVLGYQVVASAMGSDTTFSHILSVMKGDIETVIDTSGQTAISAYEGLQQILQSLTEKRPTHDEQ
ncbi:hypothetical protein EOPP23_01625 [Endozoicomonas sp. OPT23]|nr:hypothetical protein [Endozoicomonas sp. OPT23]